MSSFRQRHAFTTAAQGGAHPVPNPVVDIMAGPGRGALMVRERFNRDGQSAELERLLIYSLRDGLLGECWVYDQDQALVDAFLA